MFGGDLKYRFLMSPEYRQGLFRVRNGADQFCLWPRIISERRSEDAMARTKNNGKKNLTIRLDRQTIQKARIIAARRSTSISGLLARQIEILIGEEEAYERAERQAMTLLDQGFHLGGVIRGSRDEMHE